MTATGGPTYEFQPSATPAPTARVGVHGVTTTVRSGAGGKLNRTRTRVHHLGAVRLLDPVSGLPVGRRVAVGGNPTAIVTDGSTAWVFDFASNRLIRISAG